METFLDVIGCWPTLDDFATDVGMSLSHARVVKHRKSISSEWWPRVVAAAEKRGYPGITLELLLNLRVGRSAQKTEAAA